MRYLHPDVLDNGPAHIRENALFALLIPVYTTNYSQAVATAIITAPVDQGNFSLSNEGSGRKLVFSGVAGQSQVGLSISDTLHIAYTDGASRVLWVEGIRPSIIIGSQNYLLPVQSIVSPQPQSVSGA